MDVDRVEDMHVPGSSLERKRQIKAVIVMRMGSSCPWAFWEPTQSWLLWWTKAREISLFWGHLWNILSIVFKARALSGKSFVSVFICNLLSNCCRGCLWYSVLVLCTFFCLKAFCSFLTPNFSEIISLGNSVCFCAWDRAPRGLTQTGLWHLCRRVPLPLGGKITLWEPWWLFCLVFKNS